MLLFVFDMEMKFGWIFVESDEGSLWIKGYLYNRVDYLELLNELIEIVKEGNKNKAEIFLTELGGHFSFILNFPYFNFSNF